MSTGHACIIAVMCGVENGVRVWIGIPMLSGCWVHTDGVETSGECLMNEVFQSLPHFHRECIPIIEIFGREDVGLTQ